MKNSVWLFLACSVFFFFFGFHGGEWVDDSTLFFSVWVFILVWFIYFDDGNGGDHDDDLGKKYKEKSLR